MTGVSAEGAPFGAPKESSEEYVLDFRVVLDSLTDAVVAAGTSDSIVYVNHAAELLLGWDQEDIIGRPLWTIVPERLRPAHQSGFERFVSTGESHLAGIPLVLPARHRNGSEIEVELTISMIERPGEAPLIIGVLRDIRERMELELHNALARHLLRVMAESKNLEEATPRIMAGICDTFGWDLGELWTLDMTGRSLRCTQQWNATEVARPNFDAATKTLRLARGEGLPGNAWAKGEPVWIADTAEAENFPRREQALQDGLRAAFAFPLFGDSGLLGVLEFFSEEIREPDRELLDSIEAIAPELANFIERRRREDEIQLQKALLETQSENTLDALLVVSPDREMVSFNRRFVELWGLPDEVVANRSEEEALQAVLHKVRDPERFLERVEYLYDHPDERSREEIELLDGRIFDRYSAPLKGPDGAHLGRAWYTRDVTAERLAEQRLAESNIKYRHLAKTLQESLLPPAAVEIPGIEIATLYEPVGHGNVVGGDFYDFFRPREDEWILVVGDVCGKGVEAAAVTSLVRYTMRAVAMRGAAPEDVLAETNAAMLMHGVDERFCTVSYVRLQPAEGGYQLCSATAGNPVPLVVGEKGSITPMGTAGLPLGVFEDADVSTVEGFLSPREALVVHTDGVTDSGGETKSLGFDGLRSVLSGSRATTAAGLVEEIRKIIARVDMTERRDDCALVAARARA